jgi:hypothetical protein
MQQQQQESAPTMKTACRQREEAGATHKYLLNIYLFIIISI